MSLRDRIAKTMTECDLRGDSRLETADAILSDPEIEALRDVAMFANVMANQLRHGGYVTVRCAEDMDAALARLEEARK